MSSRRKIQTSIEVISSIADDLIEIASVKDKEEFRLKLMQRRFQSLVSSSSLVTKQDINAFRNAFRSNTLTYTQLCQLSKKLSKALNAHYKTLSVILRKWV